MGPKVEKFKAPAGGLLLCALFSLGGCTRAGQPPPAPGSTRDCRARVRLVFSSLGALDGSWDGKPAASANIWIVNADGERRRPLTRAEVPGVENLNPVFSPDGAKIVFDSRMALSGSDRDPPVGSSNIWVMNADGSGRIALTRNTRPGFESIAPSFSPDGARIVFNSKGALDGVADGTAAGSFNVWVMKADGTAKTALTRNAKGGLDSLTPVYSAEGSDLVFQSYTALDGVWDGAPSVSREIWLMSADGSRRRPLTRANQPGVNSFGPAFSADGRKVAYGSTESLEAAKGKPAPRRPAGSLNVWAAWADGTMRAPLLRNEGPGRDSFGPSFSPDGGRVLFYSKQALEGGPEAPPAGSRNVWVMSQDGGNRLPLTRNSAAQLDSWRPSFSPDATLVAFHSKMSLDRLANERGTESFNVWVMNADGSEKAPLTRYAAAGRDSYQFRGWFQPEKCFPAPAGALSGERR